MPPHQTNLTSGTGREAAGLGLDLSAMLTDPLDAAVAAPRLNATVAAPDPALSEQDAVGPPAARGILGLLARCWRGYQEWRQRQWLRTSLHELSDRELMDVGVTRAEIDCIAAHRTVDRLRDGLTYPWLSRGVM